MTKKAEAILEKLALSPELLSRATDKAIEYARAYKNLAYVGPEFSQYITKAEKKINQASLFSEGSLSAAQKELDTAQKAFETAQKEFSAGAGDASRRIENLFSDMHKRHKRDRTVLGIGAVAAPVAALTAAAYAKRKEKLEKTAFISWGGQQAILGTRPLGLEVGYRYMLGGIPMPALGIRIGTKGEEKRGVPGMNVTLGVTGVGVGVGNPKKVAPFVYTQRPAPRSIYKYFKDKIMREKKAEAALEKIAISTPRILKAIKNTPNAMSHYQALAGDVKNNMQIIPESIMDTVRNTSFEALKARNEVALKDMAYYRSIFKKHPNVKERLTKELKNQFKRESFNDLRGEVRGVF